MNKEQKVQYKIKNIDDSIIVKHSESQKEFFNSRFKEEPEIGEEIVINMIGSWDVASSPVSFIYEGNGILKASRDITVNSLQGYTENCFKPEKIKS